MKTHYNHFVFETEYGMKNKQSKIQILRCIIQISAFVLLPALFVEAFSGVKALVETLFIGSPLDIGALFPALLLIIASLLLGRFFCGWLCAFGTMGDMLYHFGRRFLKLKYKMPAKADRYLKHLKYALLLILGVTWVLGTNPFEGFSPWDSFGLLASFPPEFEYALTTFLLGTIILIGIILLSIFVERFFCRYLCPLGAIFSLASEFKSVKIKKPCVDCGKCKACSYACAMGIPLSGKDEISAGECIGCMKCIVPCQRENVRLSAFSRGIAQLFAAYAAVFIIGLYYAGNLGLDALRSSAKAENYVASSVQNGASSQGAVTAMSKTLEAAYADGSYKGSGIGYKNQTTTVNVTVSNGKITAINTVSNGDTPQYYSRAFSTIVSRIISKQSTAVDTVSGATFSSRGIINAVTSALSQAKN